MPVGRSEFPEYSATSHLLPAAVVVASVDGDMEITLQSIILLSGISIRSRGLFVADSFLLVIRI